MSKVKHSQWFVSSFWHSTIIASRLKGVFIPNQIISSRLKGVFIPSQIVNAWWLRENKYSLHAYRQFSPVYVISHWRYGFCLTLNFLVWINISQIKHFTIPCFYSSLWVMGWGWTVSSVSVKMHWAHARWIIKGGRRVNWGGWPVISGYVSMLRRTSRGSASQLGRVQPLIQPLMGNFSN